MVKILGIIPARGGSKGVPGKNSRIIGDRPLISYTIQAALDSGIMDRLVVSTDDDNIANISRDAGVEVIIRPDELATDTSPIVDAIIHVLDNLEDSGYSPSIIILLEPTSPLRTSQDIRSALKIFDPDQCESVISVSKVAHSPYWMFRVEEELLEPLHGIGNLGKRRQDLPDVFRPNGAIFITTPEHLRKTRDFYYGRIKPYIMPESRSIDIDTELDMLMLEAILKKR